MCGFSGGQWVPVIDDGFRIVGCLFVLSSLTTGDLGVSYHGIWVDYGVRVFLGIVGAGDRWWVRIGGMPYYGIRVDMEWGFSGGLWVQVIDGKNHWCMCCLGWRWGWGIISGDCGCQLSMMGGDSLCVYLSWLTIGSVHVLWYVYRRCGEG